MTKQFTNELTPEILSGMDIPQFTAEQLAEMPDNIRHEVEERDNFIRQHPVCAIYRVAVAGCLTRRGGVGVEFSTELNEGHKMRLENGLYASVLTEGCLVSYPDGSTARIISCAGSMSTSMGRGTALVGSLLDNGDEIISTPQGGRMLLVRDGVPVPDDFLSLTGV